MNPPLPEAASAAWFSLSDFSLAFFSILLEGAPFLLLGALLSVLIDRFLPSSFLHRWIPKSRAGGLFTALGAGFIFPVCECGAIPVVRRLLRKGVPVPVAVTYLLATPLFNPLCVVTTWLAFRTQDPLLMVLLRLGLGGVLLLYLGFWIGQLNPEEVLRPEALQSSPSEMETTESTVRRDFPFPAFARITAQVTRDFLSVLTFLVVGAACAAFFSTSVDRAWLQPLASHALLAPVASIALSQILCLCSTTDAFVIATFTQLPVSAKLAFLIAGPLFDWKLYWLYQSLLQRKFVHALWLRVIVGTLILISLYTLR